MIVAIMVNGSYKEGVLGILFCTLYIYTLVYEYIC